MRRRILALAIAALLAAAGCEGAFDCGNKSSGSGRSDANQEQPAGDAGGFQDG
jgi:hypothetical protein